MIQLHRAAFPPAQVACTIYCAAGIDRYLANLIAYPQYQAEHMVWGAWDGQDLLGYAHFRALPDAWHLNHIAVLPTVQGAGIGSKLWDCFVQTARQRQYNRVSLNVETDNRPVIDWYERQGLQPVEMVWRYEKSLDANSASPGEMQVVRLLAWEQAEAWQMAYGFSQFQLEYRDRVWAIGRLGAGTYRTSEPLPAPLEAVLYALDPARRLVIFSKKPLAGPDVRLLGASQQMTGVI